MTPNSPLAAWETFYVIVGSAAAALTGLQFVVIALVSDRQRERRVRDASSGVEAFGTPQVLHFSAVLFFSAVIDAPWSSLLPVALIFSTCGFAGVAYVVIIIRRAKMQRSYEPVLEDWIWHFILPFIAYLSLIPSAAMLSRYTPTSLYVMAASSLLLLFCGIHNAWDTVTYLAVDVPANESAPPAAKDH